MVRVVSDLIQSFSAIVPVRYLLIGAAVGAVLMAPSWFENVREKQIRGAVRRLVRADEPLRTEITESVVRLAGTRVRRLVTLVDAATKYDQRQLRARAIATLEATGARAEVLKIRKEIEPAKPRYRDTVEAAIRIEALLADGLVVAAQEQIAIALDQFPTDAELGSLSERIAAAIADRLASAIPDRIAAAIPDRIAAAIPDRIAAAIAERNVPADGASPAAGQQPTDT